MSTEAAPIRPLALVIDDAVTVRRYHRLLLEGIGCEVVEADNGITGLERALDNPPMLVLVDVNMPHMDGYRFVEELRRRPELRAIPVVMISTEAAARDRDAARRVAANLYLDKPVAPQDLQALAALLLGIRHDRVASL